MPNFKTDVVTLKKIMIDRGIDTIVELSDVTGIHRNVLGKILNGEKQPSADAMPKLVTGLKIPPDQAGVLFFASELT